MPTSADLAREFYATQLGLSQPWPSISELEYLFYLGAKNGDITFGGGTGLNPARPTPFAVYHNGTAWAFTTLAACQAAGLGNADPIWFIGLADPPAYRRATDIWTQA